jgi:hypothetical protein
MSIRNLTSLKNKDVLSEGRNMHESVLIDTNSIVTAD